MTQKKLIYKQQNPAIYLHVLCKLHPCWLFALDDAISWHVNRVPVTALYLTSEHLRGADVRAGVVFICKDKVQGWALF